MSDNPLLQISSLPNYAPEFSKIKTEHFLPAIEKAIANARANIEDIKNNSEAPNFENTIIALETASEDLGSVSSVFCNLLSAAGDDEMQALAEKIGPITSNFSNDVMQDEVIFSRVKAVYDQIDDLDLSTEEHMLLDDTYKDFVRGGALLDQEKKDRLRAISEKLSVLSPDFSNNNKKSTESFEMVIDNQDDLAGLPESAIDGAAQIAKDKGYDGKWVFTLDIPSYLPFMQYADNRELREKIWRAFSSRSWKGEFDNRENILEIAKLRHEKANVLGYKTHADFILERRMAETPENVWDFLEQLRTTYYPAAQKDLETLSSFAKDNGGPADIKPWDIAYYAEKLQEDLFEFTSEDLRPYFPLDQVLTGTFEHFSKLFQIRFEPNKTYDVWHEDVKAYDVFDTTNDAFVGTFYADFHPRKGKRSGAWMTSFRNQGLYNKNVEAPVICIVCNFTKPTDSKPSLLTHDEVLTLFHEMGHAVHGLLSKVTYQSLSGTNVLWDFVELPSQLQENWAYTKETLDLFASHYETGEKIPQDLIDKLNASKNFMKGWGGLRQVSLGSLDMAWHSSDLSGLKTADDVEKFEDKATEKTRLFERLAGPVSTSFGHIFAGGYSAGYYSYKWAEVLDADTFELFTQEGLYDKSVASSYKDNILSKGGTEHPAVLYRNFRGRDADPKALLRREDLISDTNQAA